MEQFKFSDLYNEMYQSFKQVGRSEIRLRASNRMEDSNQENQVSELDAIIRQRKIAEQMLSGILPKVKKQLDACTEIRDCFCNWHDKLNDHRCSLLSLNKEAESQDAELQSCLSGLYAQLNDLEKEADSCYSLINNKAKEINDKKAQLEKYFWVPFYDLYLVGDYESSLKQYQEKYNRLQGKIDNMQNQINDILSEVSEKSTISDSIKKLLQVYEYDNGEITKRMNQISQMVAQWNQFYAFFLKLKSDLETIDDVESIMASANAQLREVKKIEENIDYKHFELHETFVGAYEIRTYDDKFNLLNDPNSVYLYELTAHGNGGINHVYKIVTLSDYKSIILNEENNILTCCPNKEVRFEPIEIQNDKIADNQLMNIEKYQDSSNLYQFMSNNNTPVLCLDVHGGIFNNYTPIWVCEPNNTISQKFIIRGTGE